MAAQRRASFRTSQVGFFEKRGGSAKDGVSSVAAGISGGGSAKKSDGSGEEKIGVGNFGKKVRKNKKKKIAAPEFRIWSPTTLLGQALSSLTTVDRTGNGAFC